MQHPSWRSVCFRNDKRPWARFVWLLTRVNLERFKTAWPAGRPFAHLPCWRGYCYLTRLCRKG